MPVNDLREFLGKLEDEDELVRVRREVDWNLEAGAIMRRCCETNGPAVLFEKIKGCDPGYRLAGDIFGNIRRVAIILGLPKNTPFREIMNEWDKRMDGKPIKPRLVKTGPCKENIFKGDQVNLYKLPAPMLHDGDGGRYISTWHFIATKDPDTGWVNWGMYRQMIHNKNHLGGFANPEQHIMSMLRKYEKLNKPMEFAVAIGTDPICAGVACAELPYGVSEVEIAGQIRGEPVEVVKCETVDLEVPATSEIVIEGYVPPHVRVDEGPFGEYTGYRASPRAPRLVYKVNCITHRNNPILTQAVPGTPICGSHTVSALHVSCALRKMLRSQGLPVKDVYACQETAVMLVIVSTETPFPGLAQQIAFAIWATKVGKLCFKVMVMNDDLDIFNMSEVMHRFVIKCHPSRGTHVIEDTAGSPLTPFQNLEERLWAKSCNVVYDCTWPVDWPVEIAVPPLSSFDAGYPDHIRQKVLDSWQEYGFKK